MQKKQVAAIAAVKTLIEVHQNNIYHTLEPPNNPTLWTSHGRQTIMANRNMVQLRKK